jgi:hypothetical protein
MSRSSIIPAGSWPRRASAPTWPNLAAAGKGGPALNQMTKSLPFTESRVCRTIAAVLVHFDRSISTVAGN